MVPVVVLLVASLVLRGLGRLGVAPFATWRAAGRAGTAVMFGFTASTHFSSMKEDYVAMVPAAVPERARKPLVELTGVLQLAGAVGLLLPRVQRIAGICPAALLAAMFPANVAAARKGVQFRGKPATPLWVRAPIQALYIAVVLCTAVLGGEPRRSSSRLRFPRIAPRAVRRKASRRRQRASAISDRPLGTCGTTGSVSWRGLRSSARRAPWPRALSGR
jgi:uncharacterized membrane protein